MMNDVMVSSPYQKKRKKKERNENAEREDLAKARPVALDGQ